MHRSFTTTAHLFLAEYHAGAALRPRRPGPLRRGLHRLSALIARRRSC